jgi:hypothetical protein
VRTTLLGWKRTGRALNVRMPFDYSWWLDEVLALRKAREAADLRDCADDVSIDTVLARESEAALKAANVSDITYLTQDGIESCYYDAVARKLGPNSYEPDKLKDVPLQGRVVDGNALEQEIRALMLEKGR